MAHMHRIATRSTAGIEIERFTLLIPIEDKVKIAIPWKNFSLAIVGRNTMRNEREREGELTDERRKFLVSKGDEVFVQSISRSVPTIPE